MDFVCRNPHPPTPLHLQQPWPKAIPCSPLYLDCTNSRPTHTPWYLHIFALCVKRKRPWMLVSSASLRLVNTFMVTSTTAQKKGIFLAVTTLSPPEKELKNDIYRYYLFVPGLQAVNTDSTIYSSLDGNKVNAIYWFNALDALGDNAFLTACRQANLMTIFWGKDRFGGRKTFAWWIECTGLGKDEKSKSWKLAKIKANNFALLGIKVPKLLRNRDDFVNLPSSISS